MFRSLRWRLTLWFVLLTALVYFVFMSSATVLFKENLTAVLDSELQAIASETLPAINVLGGRPRLPEWSEGSKKKAKSLPATVQLFDAGGRLLEESGPDAPMRLLKNVKEIPNGSYSNRIWCSDLRQGHKIIGYVQIQLSTRLRDRALRQFGQIMLGGLPVLLIALGVSGYFFAGLAMQPIEQSFAVLKGFMADAGHELSTPISILQLNAESIQERLEDSDESRKNVDVILRTIERLGKLVGDLLLLSKMESPRLTLALSPLQFDDCVREVVEESSALFKDKGVVLTCNSLSSASILGDINSLKRMVANLLQNALQYTHTGGKVNVVLDVHGRTVRLKVSDTGTGIARENLKHLFGRFYRVEQSRSRSAGGTGLGLSIVKAIAKAHKGKVWVESTLGVGSTFSVTLPLRR